VRPTDAAAAAMGRLRRSWRAWTLALWVGAGLLATGVPAGARHHAEAAATGEVADEIAATDLPSAARTTLARIHAGGPFPYQRDGITFGNFEGRLPRRPRGYYHEYTVATPGAHNRGARRIIVGGDPAAGPDRTAEFYYTDDHYETFRRIRE